MAALLGDHAAMDDLETGTGTLVIERPDGRWVDRGRRYRILVDGNEVGVVARGGSLRLELAPGTHKLRAAIDWAGSPEVAFALPVGGEVHAVVESGMRFPLGGGAYMFGERRHRYLSLRVA